MANLDDKPFVIITGSSGLLGSRISSALKENYNVIGLDVKEPEGLHEHVAFRRCDMTDREDVHRVFRELNTEIGQHIASVVHLAAYYDFTGAPSPMYEELTVRGTQRLLDSLRLFTVDQLIFSSSLLVMKPVEEESDRLTEESPTRAEWAYPESKLKAEAVLRHEHGDIPIVILRIAGVYDEDGHSIPIGNQIARIHGKQLESYLFPGDKNHGQPFIHVDDVVRCVEATVGRRTELDPEEVFLIAERDVMSHEELQDAIGEGIHGHEWRTMRIPKVVAKVGAWAKDKVSDEDAFIQPWMIDLADDHYPVEIDRARAKLGWQPIHALRETLPDMIERMKRDPEGWYKLNKIPIPDSAEKSHRARGR